ncbi:trypsin-like peptidase domain-containing protein [Bradyrhizobium sp. AUGA SZCCT0222]|uniref:S1C family serine protease n=1 Tax=Bradyrhizobium sp. AUGA SZCCT0222 TaxID=2807668 RepID=UPI001BA9DFE8|nr:trypsin-like peptidase domain-containing protein [Bradyrhizobium sp. AUGA SZCCT0222]MBR1266878.1 trypsin-like peptidase domain-containing protein [Bradyrhizobium sp. AUGA SZCCT0222]
MKFAIKAIVAAFCLIATLSTSDARGPYGTINVGNWKGGAYTHDQSGAFTHCAAGAQYASGIYFAVTIDNKAGWSLGFAHDGWAFANGQAFPIVLTFDGQTPFNVHGVPLSGKLLQVPMPDNSALIAQFRKAKTMTAFTQGQLFQFKLDQTAQLLPALANCVATVKKGGVAAAGEFAVAPKQVAAAGPAQPNAAPPKGRSVNQTGTGFVVSASGHVVTNQHVINGCVGDILGNLTGEAPLKLRLVSSDETNDLALLQAPSAFKEVATIRGKAIHSGDTVVAIGYPFHGLLSSDFTVTTGIVSSLSGIMNDTRFLQISAAVQPGNSGGPLLDTSGTIAGMVAAKLNALKVARATGNIPENINFAIKTGALRDFLDNSVVPYQTAVEAKAELKTSDIARNARAFTLLISCTATEQSASAKKSSE